MPENPTRDDTTFLAVIHEMLITSQLLREQIMALNLTPDTFDPEELELVFDTVSTQMKIQEHLIRKLVEENQEMREGLEKISDKIHRARL